jgi:hypothetical protein
MPHGVVERGKSDRHDLHDNPYSCSIRTFAKDHISHQGVVRLIAVREMAGKVALTTLFVRTMRSRRILWILTKAWPRCVHSNMKTE